MEHRVDARRRRAPAASAPTPPSGSARVPVLAVEAALEVVADVEERGLLESDVDEGRLHAGQDAGDPSLHDVADDAFVPLALDVELGELAVLDQGNPGLPALCVDDDLVLHLPAWSGDPSACRPKQGSAHT